MSAQEMDFFIDNLEKINFYSLDSIHCGKAISTYMYCKNKEESLLSLLKNWVSIIITKGIKVNKIGKGSILFVFTKSYDKRKDHAHNFKKVKNLADNRTEVMPDERYLLDISRMKYYLLTFVWLFQLKKVKCTFQTKVYIVCLLAKGLGDAEEIMKSLQKYSIDIKLAVTFCDVFLIDYILTEMLKKEKIPTASVQHGHYLEGWCFSLSPSDYYLVHGEYARQGAIQSGLKAENVIVVGMMQFIGTEYRAAYNNHKRQCINNIFGVLLNGIQFDADNLFLLQCANQLAKEYGLKYIVRYHPSLDKTKYKDICKAEYILNIDGNKGSIAKFSENIEFAILGNTTVFIELINRGIPTFRYSQRKDDIYPGIDWCRFEYYEDLIELFNIMKNHKDLMKEHIKSTGDMLTPKENVSRNYKMFFNRFIKDDEE